MNPSYNGSFGTGNSGGQVPGGFGSGSFGGVPQGMTPQGFASQGQPIGSGGGDIVLGASGEQRKSKKWLVVVGVVVVILLLLGGVWISTRGSGENIVSNDAKTAFNRYANYFLYGEDKASAIGAEVPKNGDTSFANQIESTNGDSSYFQNLNALFGKFKNFMDEYSKNNDDFDATMLNNYSSELELLTIYREKGALTRANILKSYKEGGEVKAKEYIREVSDHYTSIGELNDLNYSQLLSSWGNDNLLLIMFYERSGCLTGDEIDYNCAASKINDESRALSRSMSEANDKMDMVVENSKRSLYYDLFLINDLVNEDSVRSKND